MLDQTQIGLLRRLMEAREKRDEAEKAKRSAENEYRDIEAEVHEALADGPMTRLNNVDLGPPWGRVSFHAKETYYGRIIDKEAALEGFENRALVEEMTEPKIVMARVNEVVREAIEEGSRMPPGVDFYAKRYVQITRQR